MESGASPWPGPLRPDPSVLHLDMDAFFVAVEVLDDPSLVGRPVIVGGSSERGVVAAASYEARAFGVHSAMPSMRARRLCPDAVFVPGRHHRYAEVSGEVFAILRDVTPVVESISLDEAFLDVAPALRRLGPPDRIAAELRRRVADELGLACSVGAATAKMLAKLASEAAKPIPGPDGPRRGPGVVVVAPGDELGFLHPHPVRALWGVGPVTEQRLSRLGVRTVGDLARLDRRVVVTALGRASGEHLHRLAWADDPRPVEAEREARSVGHEETFAADVHDADAAAAHVVRLADGAAQRLRAAALEGRTVTLKVRFGDFRTVTRSITVERPVSGRVDVAELAKGLLGPVDVTAGVRLLGVSVSNLSPASDGRGQQTLDLDGSVNRSGAEDAVDEIRSRFGRGAIGPASTVGGAGVVDEHRPLWGPDESGSA